MPKIAIIGGSGLDDPKILKDPVEKNVKNEYGTPSSSLACGNINGVEVVILARHGKTHGTMPSKINSLYYKLGHLTMNELLEVDESSDSEKIKKNYYRLAKEYHPDRHLTFTDPDTKMKLTTIFDALTKAYSTLKDAALRTAYYQSLVSPKAETVPQESIRAEDQFKKGITEFKAGNFWGAIDHFKWAIKLNPEHAGYLSYLSLAYSKVPGKLKEAEEVLHQAIKLEPFNADLHANLGLIYIKAGLKKRAHTSFQKALKIDPNQEKARKGLEQTKA